MANNNNPSPAGVLLVSVGLVAIAGILAFYFAFVIPPVDADVEDLQITADNDTTNLSEINATVYVQNNSSITVTDGNGTDLTRYVRFEPQSENPEIEITEDGRLVFDENACTYSYEYTHFPYPGTIPVPDNFTQETYTLTYNGQTTNVTFSCTFFSSGTE